VIKCPKCRHEWTGPEAADCEQAISIKMHEECLACRYLANTSARSYATGQAELLWISQESLRRREQFVGLMV
jgi:hypothetical protein